MTPQFFGGTALTGRSLRHITRSPDTIITTTIMPIAFLLLFVYVFGGAIDTGSDPYVNYLLPGILIITIASGISYTAFRLFLDMQSGIFERFQSMPIARSSVLWAHVLTSLVAKLRQVEDPGAIADDLLDRFSLTDAAARKVSTYSGGMRRRLDIAMSLIGNPPVIFLDEPTTGLDPQGRIEAWRTIKDLAEHGTTVLLTTQYLDEAEQLADRIAILHEGRIIANGTLAELKQLLPPAKIEYVEKQPTLEDVFFAIVGDDGKDGDAGMTAASARTSKEQP